MSPYKEGGPAGQRDLRDASTSESTVTPPQTESEGVSWAFVCAEWKSRAEREETETESELRRANLRIRCWLMVRDMDPERAERIA